MIFKVILANLTKNSMKFGYLCDNSSQIWGTITKLAPNMHSGALKMEVIDLDLHYDLEL